MTVWSFLPAGTPDGNRLALVDPPPKRNSEIILLVEDGPDLTAMMEGVITSLGYMVDTARNGAKALE